MGWNTRDGPVKGDPPQAVESELLLYANRAVLEGFGEHFEMSCSCSSVATSTGQDVTSEHSRRDIGQMGFLP